MQPIVPPVKERTPPPQATETPPGPVVEHGAPSWHDAGHTGKGIKVGIIDAGFEGFSGLMGTELPGTVHARCYRYRDIPLLNSKNVPIPLLRHTTNISDCENAVAETLIDMAPDVTLYIAQPNTNFRMRKTVDWMISEGVSVINYSMSDHWDGPGDGTSPSKYSPLRTVDRAVAGGIVWINAAGNRAKSTWTGGYVDADGDGWLEFDGVDETNEVDIQGDESFKAELRWDDPLGGSWTWASTDLDLYLYDLNGKEVASSRDLQTVRSTVPPYEFLWYRGPQGKGGLYSLRVVHRGSAIDPPHRIQLRTFTGQKLEHATAEGSISTPADSSNPGMLAAGAAAWKAWARGAVRDSSSRGPTLDGRIKPDIVGADGGKSAVKGIFVGTSQAAPHVAGLAALVRQRHPDFSPSGVVQFLKDQATVPGGVSVPNNEWGHGFAHLPADDLEAEKTPEPTTPPTRAPQTAAFASVSAGGIHTCGVRRDGSVACWGHDDDGQATPPAGEFDSVSAGSDHTCGVRRDGSVACWGSDGYGRATPSAGEFASVSAGSDHTCGVRRDGSVACWGSDGYGRATPPAEKFDSVSAGARHTCGVQRDGSVACWGYEEYGRATPPAGEFASVSAEREHTCGVQRDGSVACWGYDGDRRATPPADLE